MDVLEVVIPLMTFLIKCASSETEDLCKCKFHGRKIN